MQKKVFLYQYFQINEQGELLLKIYQLFSEDAILLRIGCEGECARVRAKSILKCACGSFFGVRCAIALLHTFWNKKTR